MSDMFSSIGLVGSQNWTIWKSYYPELLLLSSDNDVWGTTEHRVGLCLIFRIRSSLAKLQVVFYKIEEEIKVFWVDQCRGFSMSSMGVGGLCTSRDHSEKCGLRCLVECGHILLATPRSIGNT